MKTPNLGYVVEAPKTYQSVKVKVPLRWGTGDEQAEISLIENGERFIEMFGGEEARNTVTWVNGLNVLVRNILDIIGVDADTFVRDTAYWFIIECGRAMFPTQPDVGNYVAAAIWYDAVKERRTE